MKKLAILGLFALAGAANAADLYNNGPVVNGAGKSVLTSPNSVLGFGDSTTNGFAVADDFTITGAVWNISSLSFYGYQSGSSGFTFTNATWSIMSGDVNAGTLVASGMTGVTNGGLEGYRVTPATLSNTQRGIYQIDADIADISLAAGHYWLRWSINGTLPSGPWQPPTSDGALGNAAQSTGAAFATLADSGSQRSVELPFTLYGTITAVPEPSTYAMLLGGLAILGAGVRRRRKQG